jgi:hypothetical protein
MNGIHEVTGSIPVWSTTLSFIPANSDNFLRPAMLCAVSRRLHVEEFLAIRPE